MVELSRVLRGARAARLLLAILIPAGSAAQAAAEPVQQIQDNSFLLEEAYNQDAGVVQHISTFTRMRGGAWAYSVTQEWPVGGMRHQISYTVPVLHDGELADGATGLGDLALNYRYQLIGTSADDRLLLAPRLSLLLPTGDETKGRGNGSVGVQVDLPLTYMLAPQIATHWNAGATLVPGAHSAPGPSATTLSANLGGSAIWLAHPRLNLMLETVWTSTEAALPGGGTLRLETLLLAPGVRGAFDFASGLQIVPGAAYVFGLKNAEDTLLLYLSFEHRFRRP